MVPRCVPQTGTRFVFEPDHHGPMIRCAAGEPCWISADAAMGMRHLLIIHKMTSIVLIAMGVDFGPSAILLAAERTSSFKQGAGQHEHRS